MLTWRVFAHLGSLATDRLLERGLAARLSRLSATKSLISSSFTSPSKMMIFFYVLWYYRGNR